jgi:tetratricopeptide (TPR) repeat protein
MYDKIGIKPLISVKELLEIAQPFMAAEKFDEAEPYVMMALTMCDDPLGFYPKQKREKYTLVLLMWVDIKVHKGEWDEAEKALLKLEEFEDLLKKWSKLFVLKCLAVTYQNLGKTAQLHEIEQNAQKIQPDTAIEWIEYGNLHAQLGFNDKAR